MKFEKFLKGCGTHGQILERSNGDKWLICGGVGMKVPTGVINLLGSGVVDDTTKTIIEAIIKADTDDKVELIRASLEKDGKASDIIRVFGDNLDIEVGISNSDFGLLEKGDINLAEVEIEDMSGYANRDDVKFLIILDYEDSVIGFIQGVKGV